MSADPAAAPEQRLVLFEVGDAAYALPIEDVIEVTERAPAAAVPGLPPRLVGVVNHHGDALPLVSCEALFEPSDAMLPAPQYLLVLGERGGDSPLLGVPVDRVVGLADAVLGPPQGEGLVVERCALRGRMVGILELRRVLERAAALLDEAIARGAA